MSFTMSFDPSAAFRVAMEEQLARIAQTMDAIETDDPDALEMRKRLETQREDLQRRLEKMNVNANRTQEQEPEAVLTPTRTPTVSAVTSQRFPQTDAESAPENAGTKEAIRAQICQNLRDVAIPDSRFNCKRSATPENRTVLAG